MRFLPLILLVSSLAHARWATKDEAIIKIAELSTAVDVKKSGAATVTQTLVYEVLKDDGKAHLSLLKFPFSANSEKLEVLEAKVVNGGQAVVIPKDKIVSASAAKENGISDTHELQIAVPQVSLGSRVSVRLKHTQKRVLIPGHFSYTERLNDYGYVERASTVITSELPLRYDVLDPTGHVAVEETKTPTGHTYKFSLKAPLFRTLVDEAGVLPASAHTRIKVSTDPSWEKISTHFKAAFEKTLKEPLPPAFAAPIAEAAKLPSAREKLDVLAAFVGATVNYVGDWRSLESSFAPKSLAQLAATKYGDCKDFATLLVRLLREVGVPANVALVYRSVPEHVAGERRHLPTLDTFNHAITQVTLDGEKVWIDPTNKTTFGTNIRTDLAGKDALVLDGTHQLQTIPHAISAQNYLEVHKTLDLSKLDAPPAQVKLRLGGSLAVLFTGAELSRSREDVQKMFLGLVSQGETPLLPEFGAFDLRTRRYQDLDLAFTYVAKDLAEVEGSKGSFPLPTLVPWVKHFLTSTAQAEGDLFVGERYRIKRVTEAKGLFARSRPENCQVRTKWVDVNRSFEFTKDGTRVEDFVEVKDLAVLRIEFEATDFQLLQSELRRCLQVTDIEFVPGAKAHAPSAEELNKQFAKLPVKERVKKRFEFVRKNRRGPETDELPDSTVVALLRQNIQEDPRHFHSYQLLAANRLSAGYLNGEEYSTASLDESRAVIDEGLKLDPKHVGLRIMRLRNDLFRKNSSNQIAELRAMMASGKLDFKKYSEAEGARKAQIDEELKEITAAKIENFHMNHINLARIYKRLKQPDDAIRILTAQVAATKDPWELADLHFNLGMTFSSKKDYENCVHHYEKVLAIDPDTKYVYTNVPSCYRNLGNFDRAIAVVREGLKRNGSGMMKSVAASTLLLAAKAKLEAPAPTPEALSAAEELYKESIQIRSKEGAFQGLSKIALLQKNPEKARSYFLQGLDVAEERFDYLLDAVEIHDPAYPEITIGYLEQALPLAQTPSDQMDAYWELARYTKSDPKRSGEYWTKFIDVAEKDFNRGVFAKKVVEKAAEVYLTHPDRSKRRHHLQKAQELLSRVGPMIQDPATNQARLDAIKQELASMPKAP